MAFKLYDTYGFPYDLTADITRERGIQVDQAGFDAAMAVQRERAQQASQFGVDYNAQVTSGVVTEFLGYQQTKEDKAEVVEIYVDGQAVDAIAPGTKATIVLAQTPFYAESGGQIGDQGELRQAGDVSFSVADTQYLGKGIGHVGQSLRALKRGDKVEAVVHAERRQAIKRNHSATHLVHAALRNVLGDHVNQKKGP